ncbi:MAG TPA: glycosyltransferase family 2 protein [Ktedonobacterales bacterium]|nr:glycosyltransferase family 2 protein [Ktedonobacterales bacterium]
MDVSVIVPVYNEQATIQQVIALLQQVPYSKEVIIVDDCSTDGTQAILQQTTWPGNVQIYYHPRNMGKGAAIRTGVQHVTKDIVVIQDADLEYDPKDLEVVLKPIIEGKADVVYGSRFLGVHEAILFWNYLGNKLLTLATNLLYHKSLTDMETGYKAFRTPILKSLKIRCNRFDFEPEITAKVLKRRYCIHEVPISYAGRDYLEGKKITWLDAFPALWALVKYRFVD